MKRSDFYKIDHHYVTAIDGFHLSVEATKTGFRLIVYGTLMEKPEPVSEQGEPTPKQWDELLITANEFARSLRIAKNKEIG